MHLIKAKVPEVVWCQGATICVGKCALFVSKCRVSRDTHDTYPDVDFSVCVHIMFVYPPTPADARGSAPGNKTLRLLLYYCSYSR